MRRLLLVFGGIGIYTLGIGVLSWFIVEFFRAWAAPPPLLDTLFR